MPPQDSSMSSPIGRRTPRVDGPLKVTGQAKYTADFRLPGMLYAVPVEATIANGRLLKLDTSSAEKMPGVRAIFHRENIGKIFRSVPGPGFDGIAEERRPPFEDDIIRYYGQYVALAVADTFEAAKAAADAVRVSYASELPNVRTDLEADDDPEVMITSFGPKTRLQSARGDADAAFANAPVKLDQTYVTPAETQNPLEPHATIAAWEGSTLTLYESSQGVVNLQSVLAQMFALPRENVRVITKFIGSGFGSKLFPWTQCPLAAAAAKQLGRPVKLVLSRKMMFQTVGHRPHTQQRVRLGATADGNLVSLQHDYVYTASMLDSHHEDCGECTAFMYSVPNLRVAFGRARRHIGAGADMRGPGAVPGLYAIESAMNEMADQLKIDAVQFRILNEPKLDESKGIPFSSRRLLDCYQLGTEKFGWSRRTPEVGSMTRLGHGRVFLAGGAVFGQSERPTARRRHGPCRLSDPGHWHRHLYDPRSTCRRKDRRVARQSRSGPRRHDAAARTDLGWVDGDRIFGPRRLRRRGSGNHHVANRGHVHARNPIRRKKT
jgi:xanthine dehydrogenase YagR molybdenum-binding subunit